MKTSVTRAEPLAVRSLDPEGVLWIGKHQINFKPFNCRIPIVSNDDRARPRHHDINGRFALPQGLGAAELLLSPCYNILRHNGVVIGKRDHANWVADFVRPLHGAASRGD
jgi:hypothetical protein